MQQHLATLNALLGTCAEMQHRTSSLLPGTPVPEGASEWDAHSEVAESTDGMVEDAHFEDAAEDFSSVAGTHQPLSLLPSPFMQLLAFRSRRSFELEHSGRLPILGGLRSEQ